MPAAHLHSTVSRLCGRACHGRAALSWLVVAGPQGGGRGAGRSRNSLGDSGRESEHKAGSGADSILGSRESARRDPGLSTNTCCVRVETRGATSSLGAEPPLGLGPMRRARGAMPSGLNQ